MISLEMSLSKKSFIRRRVARPGLFVLSVGLRIGERRAGRLKAFFNLRGINSFWPG
jgi:hypothetical protein